MAQDAGKRTEIRPKQVRIDATTVRILLISALLFAAAYLFDYALHDQTILTLFSGAALGLLLGEIGVHYWDRRESRLRHEELKSQFEEVKKEQKAEFTRNYMYKYRSAAELGISLYSYVLAKERKYKVRERIEFARLLTSSQSLGISEPVMEITRDIDGKSVNNDVELLEIIIRDISAEFACAFKIGWLGRMLGEATGAGFPDSLLDSLHQKCQHLIDYVDLLVRLKPPAPFKPELVHILRGNMESWVRGEITNTRAQYTLQLLDWYVRRFWSPEDVISELTAFIPSASPPSEDFDEKAHQLLVKLEIAFPSDNPSWRILEIEELLKLSKGAGTLAG